MRKPGIIPTKPDYVVRLEEGEWFFTKHTQEITTGGKKVEASELIKRVRKIEIKTRGLTQHIFAGQYHSAFKGKGMTFSEVREYQYGDDIRNVDWNVTARFNHPYSKVYEEERELTVMLMVDVSGSRDFGSRHQMKKNMITEIAAVLAFSAIQNNDKVGVILFSDRVEKFIPAKKGRSHILLDQELINYNPETAAPISLNLCGILPTRLKEEASPFLFLISWVAIEESTRLQGKSTIS
jgi:uncharacterized protein (DUF58 family)